MTLKKPSSRSRPPARLFIDLVPRSAWSSNIRSEVTAEEWKDCCRVIYKYFNYRCDVCQGWGPKHPVECHERWAYDEKTKVQTLVDLVALCPDCHEATHFGYACTRGREEFARAHLRKINGWDERQLKSHIAEAYTTWDRRSGINWLFDGTFFLGVRIPISDETRFRLLDLAAGKRPRVTLDGASQKDQAATPAKTAPRRASMPAPARRAAPAPNLSRDLKFAIDTLGLDNERAASACLMSRSQIADLHVVGLNIDPESNQGRASIALIEASIALLEHFKSQSRLREWLVVDHDELGGRPIDLICEAGDSIFRKKMLSILK